VHRHVHSKIGTVYAYKPEIDAWWTNRGTQIESQPFNAQAAPGPWFRRPWMMATAPGALLVLAIGAWLVFRSVPHSAPPRLIPLTTYPGIEGPPSLSPDGSQVVFERNGDIFVKQADGEAFVQLTKTPMAESSPVWSPDGRQIAFTRDGTELFLTSPLGGGERKVAGIRVPLVLNTTGWMPSGESLVISELTSSICASLFLVSVATGERGG